GKGMPAALLMATVRAALRSVAGQHAPARALALAAAAIQADLEASGSFVTLFHAQLNASTGRLAFVDAGHGHVFLRRAEGLVTQLEPRGMPLGVLAEEAYQEGSAMLAPGD